MGAVDENGVFHVIIPGKPFAWRRTGGRGFRRYEDPKQKEWKEKARAFMLQAIGGGARPVFPSGALEIVVKAFWGPTGKPRKRIPRVADWRPARPDGDNVYKVFADCSEGFVVGDDCQYVRIVIEKWSCHQDDDLRTEIAIRELERRSV